MPEKSKVESIYVKESISAWKDERWVMLMPEKMNVYYDTLMPKKTNVEHHYVNDSGNA